MKPYLIHFWHGAPPLGSSFLQKVEKLVQKDASGNYMWHGTLDDFFKAWCDKFILLKPSLHEEEYISGRICITSFGGFGQK